METKGHGLYERAKPFIAVVFLQFGFSGMDILCKAALNEGVSNYVLVVYRHAVATIVMTPFAVFLDKKVRPKMTLQIFIKLMVLSLLEPVIDQNFYFIGLRLEKVKCKSIRSQAKIIGTAATVGGAMIMTLMKGPLLELFWTKAVSTTHQHQSAGGTSLSHSIKGALMITIGCFSWACFMVLQAITLKTYPAELSLTAWVCLLGTLEGTAVALVMERGNQAAWAVKWDMKLAASLYSGVVCSGLAYYIQGIVMKERGPVFVTAFSPLSMVFVAIMSSFILGEQLFLGRVIGATIIVVGLYLVVWGKSNDHISTTPITDEESGPNKQILNASCIGKENSNHEVITMDETVEGSEANMKK
ncbi:hypothetical protein FEM48_Zijuj12G0147500 [Ziziphus jujuba var. spinosa]|uniref:WAT1-related protein n=1 Tax=Ziziphus jujuba var. spinosa TaxID=714518 RepID=A0A978UDY3_ZIZJJ|nr:hypothetical protein FEM48_Zijuj12G0147500 [Ziziphus jujuba var. spinosa]